MFRGLALRVSWLVLLWLCSCDRRDASGSEPLQAERQRPLTPVSFERTPERVERGRYLADAVIGCVLCHSERDTSLPGAPPRAGREYGGSILEESPGYRMVAPNISPDPETGAGTWTDDMFARAIREGVGHDGRGLGLPMWWWSFRSLDDEDLQSIVVYLRSRPPVRNPLPKRILNAEQERERAAAAQPLTSAQPTKSREDPVQRGIYLISVADCMGCHSAWEAKINAGAFAGGNAIRLAGEVTFSANITPDPSAIGAWTAELFTQVIRSGKSGTLRPVMPWAAYRNMSDEDLRAIFLALREVAPVRHFVSNLASPTACVVCGQTHGSGDMNTVPVIERVEDDRGPLDRYAGRYRIETDDVVIEHHNGVLFASLDGTPAVELIPTVGGRFAGRGLPSALAFEHDETGRVTAMLSYELGTTRWARDP